MNIGHFSNKEEFITIIKTINWSVFFGHKMILQEINCPFGTNLDNKNPTAPKR